MIRSELSLGIVKGLQPPNTKSIADEGAGATHTPKIANPALARAVSLHLDGQLSAALKHLREALASGNSQPVFYSAIGHILCELREFEEAAENYSKLLELEPEHRSAHFNKGVCLARMSRWEEARTRILGSLPPPITSS